MAARVKKIMQLPPRVVDWRSALALLVGFWVTFRHLVVNLFGFGRGRQGFTVYFPEERFLQAPALREIGVYLVSDGTGKPYKCRCRAPSFSNTQPLARMIAGHQRADSIPTFDMINMIGGECDR
jgi:hypothetical protein